MYQSGGVFNAPTLGVFGENGPEWIALKRAKNSLIGAGSVITKDVPADSVIVGNPGKVIKKIEELTCRHGWFSRPYLWPPYEEEK